MATVAASSVIDPDQPAERVYLDALGSRMNPPVQLHAHLDKQATG